MHVHVHGCTCISDLYIHHHYTLLGPYWTALPEGPGEPTDEGTGFNGERWCLCVCMCVCVCVCVYVCVCI